jgi:hypothetical protein
MADVLVRFETVLTAPDGRRFAPQACGQPAGNVWEAWIELVPLDGSTPLRTERETEQPNRDDLMYWAEGLTAVYLDGALSRALQKRPIVERPRPLESSFEGPAAPGVRTAAVPSLPVHPVLDPFRVAQQGEDILARELSALDTAHIRDIVLAYELSSPDRARSAPRDELTAIIIAAVRGTPGTVRDAERGAEP